uniref:Metalloendopeptidase n=1 Tax=Crassostrea virginica TaxID=6565 RepID=A0A8B8C1I9_CRAVI|nr:blastula protease 10-like [Crassostrea virginica]
MRIALLSTLVLLTLAQLSIGKVTYTKDEIQEALREYIKEVQENDEDSPSVVSRAKADSLDNQSLDAESDDEDDAESQKVELPDGEKTPTNTNSNGKEEQKQDSNDKNPPPLSNSRREMMRIRGLEKSLADAPYALAKRTIYSVLKKVNSKSKRIFASGAILWENGRIPYTIDEKTFEKEPEELKVLKTILSESIEQLSTTTCVNWVKRDSETDYVNIINDSGCYSYVGKIGGGQPVSMQANGCMTVHTMLHEMLHAMGTEHEQSRSDRAGMTSMIWNNIDSNNLNNFQMGQTSNAQPYDYKSLMQYELWSFAKDGGKSMSIPDKSLEYLISNKKVALSLYDIGEINSAYGCTKQCTNKCQNGGIVIVDKDNKCGCKCPTGLKGDDCSQLDTSEGCGGFVDVTAGQKTIALDTYTAGIDCTWLVKGGANTRIKATIDKLDLPYNDNFDCYHWLEFRDYLIGDNGKERCGTEGGASFTKMVIGDPSRMMIRFNSAKHKDKAAGKGFSLTVKALQSGCSKFPCKNGGLCTDKDDGTYKCSCINGFSGDQCNDLAATASTKCDFQDDFRGCVFQENKAASAVLFSLASSPMTDVSGNTNGYQYLSLTYGWEMKKTVLETSAKFEAAERCLSFQYYYRTDQFYNDGYDSTLTVTSSGSSTALLKIGDANTPLNKWTAVKVTVPSTPDLKLTIEGVQGTAEMGMDDISLKPGACA